MKARKFFAFVAAVGMLFAGGGCAPDEPIDDLEKATLSVTPTEKAFTLVGGEVTLELTSNCAWNIEADASDVKIVPTSGNGNASVTVTVPESTVARNIALNLTAQRIGSIAGSPYPTSAEATVILFQNENGEAKFATNVKAVRAALKKGDIPSASNADGAVAVSAEVAAMTLTAVVVGEADGNMSLNQLLAVQDDSTEPESGLMLYCENAKSMDKGQVVKVSLATAKVADYNGIIQLYTDNVVALGAPIEVTPIEATLANMRDYESQYIKISNLHPDPSAVGKKFSEAASNKSIAFFDANYDQITIRLSNYASFKDDVIPAKEGAVCGISSYYNYTKELQLMPQYLSDFELTTDFVFDTQTVTIAQITKPGLYKVENAWVVGFTGNGVILTDSSNAFINVYKEDNEYKTIGEKMTIEGVANNYQGGYQFDTPKITKVEGTEEVTYPTPTDYTESTAVEQLAAKFGGEDAPYLAEYAEFSGIVNISGEHHNLFLTNVDKTVIVGSLSKSPNEALQLASFDGKLVKLRGFVTGYNTPYLSITTTSVELDTSGMALSADNVPLVLKEGVTDAFTKLSSSGLTKEDITVTPDGTVVTAASVDIENSKLIYTVSANSGDQRVGTITLSVEGLDDVKVEVTQLGVNDAISTIAEVWKGSAESYITIGVQAVASYKSGKYTNIIVADKTGAIALFNPSVTPAIGDYMNIIGGTSTYNGLFQFNAPTVILTGENAAPVHPVPVVKDAAALDGMAATVVAPEYVQYRGVLTVNNTFYNVEIDGANTAIGSLKPMDDDMENTIKGLANMPIIVTGYFYGVSSNKYLNTIPTSVELDTTVKLLKADDITGVSADGVTDATTTIMVANLGTVTATFDGAVVTNASVDGNVLTYTVSANTTTEVREGSITLSADGVESVTIKVSQVKGLDLNATSYSLTVDDIKNIYFPASSGIQEWNLTAVDGSSWSGVAYKNTNYYQFSWKVGANTLDQNKTYLLCPVIPEGKKIVKITITPDGKTSDNRYFVVLPSDFEYKESVTNAFTEANNAAYGISSATIAESTEPLVIDLSDKNATGQVQIRALGGAAYITNIKIDFE